MMYNSTNLSLYTPDVFSIDDPKRDNIYKELCQGGFKYAATKRIVIAALVRDVEERLPEIKKKVERVAKIFKDYRVLIVENDSKDNTRQELLKWSKTNPKITILGCGRNVKECSIKMAKTKTNQDFLSSMSNGKG